MSFLWNYRFGELINQEWAKGKMPRKLKRNLLQDLEQLFDKKALQCRELVADINGRNFEDMIAELNLLEAYLQVCVWFGLNTHQIDECAINDLDQLIQKDSIQFFYDEIAARGGFLLQDTLIADKIPKGTTTVPSKRQVAGWV